jgi:heme/copper-type cytochrome/quinol oxidase subunit 4
MQELYLIGIATIVVATLCYCLMALKKDFDNKASYGRLLAIVFGIIVGTSAAFIFYPPDNTKGWNPFGWWFPATLVVAVIAGLLAPIIFSAARHKWMGKQRHDT